MSEAHENQHKSDGVTRLPDDPPQQKGKATAAAAEPAPAILFEPGDWDDDMSPPYDPQRDDPSGTEDHFAPDPKQSQKSDEEMKRLLTCYDCKGLWGHLTLSDGTVTPPTCTCDHRATGTESVMKVTVPVRIDTKTGAEYRRATLLDGTVVSYTVEVDALYGYAVVG